MNGTDHSARYSFVEPTFCPRSVAHSDADSEIFVVDSGLDGSGCCLDGSGYCLDGSGCCLDGSDDDEKNGTGIDPDHAALVCSMTATMMMMMTFVTRIVSLYWTTEEAFPTFFVGVHALVHTGVHIGYTWSAAVGIVGAFRSLIDAAAVTAATVVFAVVAIVVVAAVVPRPHHCNDRMLTCQPFGLALPLLVGPCATDFHGVFFVAVLVLEVVGDRKTFHNRVRIEQQPALSTDASTTERLVSKKETLLLEKR